VRRIEVTYSTMGQSNPAHVAERKDYAWNGDPAKSEAARTARRPRPVPESLRGNPSRRREEKEKRYAEFCEHRKNGVDVRPAGALVGVERRAAARYEKRRREELGAGSGD